MRNSCIEEYHCLYDESIVLTIISSVGSIVGSLLIVGTFLRWKELRTVARMILVFLAIADLLTGIGYIFGAVIYAVYQRKRCNNSSIHDHMIYSTETYDTLCEVQSFMTTLFPVASFLWTGNLSVYLFVSLGLRKIKLAKKLMIPFHVTAWGIPLVICIALLGMKKLGSSSNQSNSAWCWIKDDYAKNTNTSYDEAYVKYFVLEMVAGKMWEVIVILVSLCLCLAMKLILWRRYKAKDEFTASVSPGDSYSIQMRTAFTKVDQKLIWIPVVFLLVRIWGIVRFFMSVPPIALGDSHCYILYNRGLIAMQSIGDPGQGWSNALLFVIFNDKIFQKLCPCLFICGLWCQGQCDSARVKLKQRRQGRRLNRTHIIKKSLVNGGIVTYDNNNEKKSLLSDSLKSSVLYHSNTTTENANQRKSELGAPDANSSINHKSVS